LSVRGLVFYPHNFFALSCGSHRRMLEIAEYFLNRKMSVDLISLDGFTRRDDRWDEDSLKRAESYFERVFICDGRPTFWNRVKLRLPTARIRSLFDFRNPALIRMLHAALNDRSYDFFLNSYVYWACLADDMGKGIRKIIDMHDFVTLNHHYWSGKKEFRLGRMLEQEINALEKHDYCISISEEESIILQPFCSHAKFVNLPMSFPARFHGEEPVSYDLVTVASDNPFNRIGMQWFMNEVYPLLPSSISIAIVGGIAKRIGKRQNTHLIPYADNLDDIYYKSRIACCPVRSGTGLKVKVIEALSYGKPVVTTPAGLSGILQKENNGCMVADDPRRFAQSIMALLYDQNVCMTVTEQGKSFFLKKFTREACWPKLDSIISSIDVGHQQ
jgi:glycosyltransferase involved in cell wall biosynthesis